MTARDISPASTADLTWRPLRYGDLPGVHALLLAAAQADQDDHSETLADLQTQFDDPWSQAEADARVALAADGTVAAYARCFCNPAPENEAVVHLWPEVHPAYRGRGLEASALDWLTARAAERLRSAPPGLPRDVRLGVRDTQADRISLLEQRGFKPIRYFYRMKRALAQPIPAPALPDGLSLRTYSADVDQALFEAYNESFRDHWSFEPVTREDWEMFFIGNSGFRPDNTLLVLAGDQVAAFSINYERAEDNARTGLNAAVVGQLGTRRAWRKRGLATALLCESMRRFQAAGFDWAMLGVDAENPTGALGLYERLGFVQAKRMIVYARPVEG